MIRLGRDGEHIFVEVQDQGKGMSAERLAEVQTRGVGVGIPGIRERVPQFHGELTIESNALGTRLRAVLLAPVGTEYSKREPVVIAVHARAAGLLIEGPASPVEVAYFGRIADNCPFRGADDIDALRSTGESHPRAAISSAGNG